MNEMWQAILILAAYVVAGALLIVLVARTGHKDEEDE